LAQTVLAQFEQLHHPSPREAETMETHFLLTSAAFAPTPGELDDAHDDFINPGMYALELADFLENEFQKRGYTVKFRCQEDWGHWMELQHKGDFTLAICCANTGDSVGGQAEHRVFLTPDKPYVRKLFKKIDVRSDIEQLASTLRDIFDESAVIDNIRVEDTG
jgi:hypothetical protein